MNGRDSDVRAESPFHYSGGEPDARAKDRAFSAQNVGSHYSWGGAPGCYGTAPLALTNPAYAKILFRSGSYGARRCAEAPMRWPLTFIS